MVPEKADAQWLKLIKGEASHDFKNVSAGLMLSRLKRQFSGGFSVNGGVDCVDELHAFFTKYEQLLVDDISAIFGRRL